MARYSVFPLYGDASVIVVDAESLLDAIQRAFGVTLESIAKLHSFITSEQTGEPALFYGVTGAYGTRDKSLTILCSSTVITYSVLPKERQRNDVVSVEQLTKAKHLYDFSKET